MADLTQLLTLREHYASTLAHLDEVIEGERARLRLNENEVAQRKVENAVKVGRTLGNTVGYATAETVAELQDYLRTQYAEGHLVDAALRGARESWANAEADGARTA